MIEIDPSNPPVSKNLSVEQVREMVKNYVDKMDKGQLFRLAQSYISGHTGRITMEGDIFKVKIYRQDDAEYYFGK